MKTEKMKAEAMRKNLLHILKYGNKDLRDVVKSELKILAAYCRLKTATDRCQHHPIDLNATYRWCTRCGAISITHPSVQPGWMIPEMDDFPEAFEP